MLLAPLNGFQRGAFIGWICSWSSSKWFRGVEFKKVKKWLTTFPYPAKQALAKHGEPERTFCLALCPNETELPWDSGKHFLNLSLNYEEEFTIIWLLRFGQMWTSAYMSKRFCFELFWFKFRSKWHPIVLKPWKNSLNLVLGLRGSFHLHLAFGSWSKWVTAADVQLVLYWIVSSTVLLVFGSKWSLFFLKLWVMILEFVFDPWERFYLHLTYESW